MFRQNDLWPKTIHHLFAATTSANIIGHFMQDDYCPSLFKYTNILQTELLNFLSWTEKRATSWFWFNMLPLILVGYAALICLIFAFSLMCHSLSFEEKESSSGGSVSRSGAISNRGYTHATVCKTRLTRHLESFGNDQSVTQTVLTVTYLIKVLRLWINRSKMDEKKSKERSQKFCMDLILRLWVSKQYEFSVLLSAAEMISFGCCFQVRLSRLRLEV